MLRGSRSGGFYYRSLQSKHLTDKDTLVLSDFDNKTGDSVFDDTLKRGLSVQLQQSPFLELAALRLAPNRDVRAIAALALARAVDTVRRRIWRWNSTRNSRRTR